MAISTDIKRMMGQGKQASGPVTRRIHLAPREVLTVRVSKPGLQIVSEGSVLWITQEGQWEDHFLNPGEHYTVAQPGSVVIQGMRC